MIEFENILYKDTLVWPVQNQQTLAVLFRTLGGIFYINFSEPS